ncbi:PREDICTED: long-chain-alcohol oxidase FAO4A-like isoform X2 [Nelumbo nucifera]|uniref:Long-chain-alcohol oxidase n=1 Tax=Nelumbo nucifera TaxID=4432 RepID=A0A1U8B4T4_NELNU|nr:PREDICTED: long-chain-alcohol oxidase FAO4A-like isoform X2 [Nelumbo nucifera]
MAFHYLYIEKAGINQDASELCEGLFQSSTHCKRRMEKNRPANLSYPEKTTTVNSLSSREMHSLCTLCDTLLPSINHSATDEDDSLSNFYWASASTTATPQLKFSQVSQKKREEILLSWSTSSFSLLRMLFKIFKLLLLFVFFTQVDEKNENPSWKALGYCGPDPDFKHQTQASKTDQDDLTSEEEEKKEELFGPLYRRLINPRHPRQSIAEYLEQSGFPVTINHFHGNKTPSISSPSLTIRCDAVVVGSGSGGSVAAAVLAKAGYKVLVLEKGKYFARNNLSLLEGPSLEQMYLDGGLTATDDLGVFLFAGATVGGGSTVNWSASIRTPGHVMEEWCYSHKLELFDRKPYNRAMDVVCNRMGVQVDTREESFNNAVLRRGCLELGYPVSRVSQNAPMDHYCGWCGFGCKDGKKQGTAETWLVDLVDSGNGVILPGCEALKVLHERKRRNDRSTAIGVAFRLDNGSGGHDICVVESKVTVVACGALRTPVLLKRSGLKNTNIGKHLRVHPVVLAWGYFADEPASSNGDEWVKDKRSYEGGILTSMSTVVAGFEGSGYGAILQTPSLHPGLFSVLMPWVSGADFKERMSRFSRTAHVFALARDKGSGQVNSESSLSYRLDAIDEENLSKGVEKMLRILAAAGAEEIGTHHCEGRKLNVKRASKDEFEKFVKEESGRKLGGLSTPVASAHQMGSCRMGVDRDKSVVCPRGETWEVEGLFVADTSVFPTALGVNPMVTVQAISYCTAHSVIEFLERNDKAKDGGTF